MERNSKVQKFTTALQQKYSEPVLPNERFEVEQELGEGAVKYKLNKSGMHLLFKAAERTRLNKELR